ATCAAQRRLQMAMTAATGMSAKRKEHLINQQAMVFKQANLMIDTAAREDRGLTEEEEKKYTALMAQHAKLEEEIQRAAGGAAIHAEIDRMFDRQTTGSPNRIAGSSAGVLFANQTADFFKGGGHRTGAWRTEAIEVPYASIVMPSLYAATLSEDPASGG